MIDLLAQNPFCTVNGMADKLNVAFTTAQRAVDRLESAGVVKRVSEGKAKPRVLRQSAPGHSRGTGMTPLAWRGRRTAYATIVPAFRPAREAPDAACVAGQSRVRGDVQACRSAAADLGRREGAGT